MTRSLKLFGLALFGALAFTASCGGDDGGGDDTGTGATGGGGTGGSGGGTCNATLGFPGTCKTGADEECCATTLPVLRKRDKDDNLIAPDWSCIGIGAAMGGTGGTGGTTDAGADAAAGAAGAATGGAAGTDGGTSQNKFEVTDFSNSNPVADIEVELYEGDSIFGKQPFHTDFTKGTSNHTDDSTLNVGQFYFPHPAFSVLSYRVKEKPGTSGAKEFVGFGYDIPAAPGKVEGNTLSPSTYAQLANYVVPIVGWSPPTDLAIITGPIRDCAGDDVGGALIKFFDESTGQEVQPGCGDRDIRYVYFDGSYPNTKCTFTDYRQSLWVIVNAVSNAPGQPGAGKKYRVEYWGRLKDSDPELGVKFAQKSLEIFANTVNVHNVVPNVQQ